MKAETEDRKASAKAIAEKNGMEAKFLLVKWEVPATAIVNACRQQGCDLIVIASHGRSGLSAVLLGSVTAKVIADAPVPVLVVH